jgi:hypothetical protein
VWFPGPLWRLIERKVLDKSGEEMAVHSQKELLGTHLEICPTHVGKQAKQEVKAPLMLDNELLGEEGSKV